MQVSKRTLLNIQGIGYSWRQLAQRVGIVDTNTQGFGFDTIGVNVYYDNPEHILRKSDLSTIIVVPSRSESWQTLLEQREKTLLWIPLEKCIPYGSKLPFSGQIPVLFWGAGFEDGQKSFVERREDGVIIFYADIIAATFFMLSRWEETVVSVCDHDQYDRFPASASVSFKQDYLDRPIVDEYALILQKWLKTLLTRWVPKCRHFSVKLSHDIDHIQRFSTPYLAMRALAGDMIKRHKPMLFIDTLLSIVKPNRDDFLHAIYHLADLSEAYGFKSAFYFMSAVKGLYDSGYDITEQKVRRCIDDLIKRGHEIGFHPSYHTIDDPHLFLWEKMRLEEVIGGEIVGGRQHFLRFRTPDTWRLWEKAGFAYDSTLCYADHEGFRCGTCHPFHPFDIEQNRELNIMEIPLIVMDGTLNQYRRLTPDQGKMKILNLANRCKQVNGVFTMLWHNSSFQGVWASWSEMYQEVLSQLSEIDV